MKKLLFFLAASPLFFSCSSDEGTLEPGNDFVSALVIFTGEPEVDGCGYMLKIEDVQYKPVNLPSKYHQHGLKLLLTYKEDPTGYLCGDLPFPKTTIEILDVFKE